MTAVIDAQISALRVARDHLIRSRDSFRAEPRMPWLEYEGQLETVADFSNAIHEIEDQIIGLERSMRDPEQDAEIRAEINASIALNGNWDDDASYYMHTPMEEELFQNQIHAELRYEEGDYGPFSCGVCNNTIYEGDELMVDGHCTCELCNDGVIAWMTFVSAITGTPIAYRGRWNDEPVFVMEHAA